MFSLVRAREYLLNILKCLDKTLLIHSSRLTTCTPYKELVSLVIYYTTPEAFCFNCFYAGTVLNVYSVRMGELCLFSNVFLSGKALT